MVEQTTNGRPAGGLPAAASIEDTTADTLLETGWAFTDAYGHRIRLPEPIEAPPPPAEAA